MLKNFLRFNEVYIPKNEKTPGKETKLSISAQLARLLKEDEFSLWPEKNLQKNLQKLDSDYRSYCDWQQQTAIRLPNSCFQ
jgi:hypothetical protein